MQLYSQFCRHPKKLFLKPQLTAFVFALLCISCTNRVYLHRINYFLNAHSIEARGKFLSEDYHSFFAEKKGKGKNKSAALKSFSNWDAPLNPDIKIISYKIKGSEWEVEFNEQSDFTKPIGFPGWKGKQLITFNSHKQITQSIYIPNDENPDYKEWLQPAMDWLEKNHPAELKQVYQEHKLVQNPEAARKWVSLLQQWKEATRH